MMPGLRAAGLLLLVAAAPSATSRPVIVGEAGADMDACLSTGAVHGLNPRGDNFLAVRAAPSTNAAIVARLRANHPVHICDSAGNDAWIGIVFTPTPRSRRDCLVGSPVPRPQAYRGPCRSGWVAARYILHLAG